VNLRKDHFHAGLCASRSPNTPQQPHRGASSVAQCYKPPDWGGRWLRPQVTAPQLPKCTPGALGQRKLPCCLALARALAGGTSRPASCVRASALGALCKHGRQHPTKTTPNLVSEREARPLGG